MVNVFFNSENFRVNLGGYLSNHLFEPRRHFAGQDGSPVLNHPHQVISQQVSRVRAAFDLLAHFLLAFGPRCVLRFSNRCTSASERICDLPIFWTGSMLSSLISCWTRRTDVPSLSAIASVVLIFTARLCHPDREVFVDPIRDHLTIKVSRFALVALKIVAHPVDCVFAGDNLRVVFVPVRGNVARHNQLVILAVVVERRAHLLGGQQLVSVACGGFDVFGCHYLNHLKVSISSDIEILRYKRNNVKNYFRLKRNYFAKERSRAERKSIAAFAPLRGLRQREFPPYNKL